MQDQSSVATMACIDSVDFPLCAESKCFQTDTFTYSTPSGVLNPENISTKTRLWTAKSAPLRFCCVSGGTIVVLWYISTSALHPDPSYVNMQNPEI